MPTDRRPRLTFTSPATASASLTRIISRVPGPRNPENSCQAECMTKRNLAPQDASSALDDVVALLGPPPLLSTEDPQIYHDLLSRVVLAAGPRHMIEWILVRDFEWGSFSSFEGRLSTYERLEKMLASLELKRHMLLRDAQYYREGLAHLLQDISTDDVVDADANDSSSK
jgi:hypothetical protein